MLLKPQDSIGEFDKFFAPATIAPVMISSTTEILSEGNDWVFGSG